MQLLKKLSYEERSALLFEVEIVVINHHITSLYPNNLESCVTPNHLLFGRQSGSSSSCE